MMHLARPGLEAGSTEIPRSSDRTQAAQAELDILRLSLPDVIALDAIASMISPNQILWHVYGSVIFPVDNRALLKVQQRLHANIKYRECLLMAAV
jgi:hypothetical protein